VAACFKLGNEPWGTITPVPYGWFVGSESVRLVCLLVYLHVTG
jgi:hypothetical protein